MSDKRSFPCQRILILRRRAKKETPAGSRASLNEYQLPNDQAVTPQSAFDVLAFNDVRAEPGFPKVSQTSGDRGFRVSGCLAEAA